MNILEIAIFWTILLEEPAPTSNPVYTIIGGSTVLIALIGFLIKMLIKDLKDGIKLNSERIDVVEEKVIIERSRSDQEMRTIDSRISELHINILSKLDEIKDKFNEFRK